MSTLKIPKVDPNTVANWSAEVRRAFVTAVYGQDVPPVVTDPTAVMKTRAGNFYDTWSTLLGELFPAAQHFLVKLQGYSGDARFGTADFMISYEICYRGISLSTIEIKPPQNVDFASHRREADLQLRDHMYDISSIHKSNKLETGVGVPFTVYGLSVFGTCMAFYVQRAEAANICFPLKITQDLTDLPPRIWWSTDVRTVTGRYLLRQFAADICNQAHKTFEKIRGEETPELVDPMANIIDVDYGQYKEPSFALSSRCTVEGEHGNVLR
ncbi:hypothetical protein C8R44DRAFT_873901 [Mycena epipterygia]|nr:hypothetical protein C8R44DRAFT_873901 [Mycena epipterygia]